MAVCGSACKDDQPVKWHMGKYIGECIEVIPFQQIWVLRDAVLSTRASSAGAASGGAASSSAAAASGGDSGLPPQLSTTTTLLQLSPATC
eukprot:5685017-Amphidinium_carterae.1